jgi:taurine dioxygenase
MSMELGSHVRQYETIVVDPVTPFIGADVTGVSLAEVDDRIFAEIYDAWIRHKVLFFRDQTEFTPVHMEDLGRRFGEIDVPPKALPTSPEAPYGRLPFRSCGSGWSRRWAETRCGSTWRRHMTNCPARSSSA